MLSLDLFDSRYEKRLHEGALDDTITRTQAHLMEPLSRRAAEILTQLRSGKLNAKKIDQLKKEYDELVKERQDIIFSRQTQTEQQVPSKQDPFAYVKPEPKGIGDTQDPRDKMAQLQQRSKKGPLANVAAGIKAFVKGEPEPMGEEQQAINPRALGVANFQRLVKANMGNIPTVSLEFIRPEENFKLDQRGLDLISDYYDGLENDQAKNYFIYRVLPSGEETLKVLKQLGYSPVQAQQQQNLPGIPTQGELPLQEKKKSNNDDLEAGDIKVARELQKLRAEYPAARSDVEAVARAEIDSTERSQRQLSAIRGANEKQDALLKQLVALDQEQGREISGLDKENNSLEQRLAQVQATNDRLQQAIGQMTGTKKAAAKTKTTAPQGSADVAQGGIIDVGTPAPAEPIKQVAEPKEKPIPTKSAAIGSVAQQLGGFSSEVPLDTIKPPPASMRKAAESKIKEHGGGIGPKQHWQSMMPETALNPQDPQGDYEAKRRALHDLSLNKDVDQAAVLQRRLDLDREARAKGVTEGTGQSLSVQQLATISDEALDTAYHYGRSSPGNTFGWQANLKSASFAKQMIDRGVTDIEAISDAIHKGWNVTAQAFVKNPQMFDDSKTMAPEKLQAKIAQRQKLMTQQYAELPEDEKEKDRVVARAMLQAITGQQNKFDQYKQQRNTPAKDSAEYINRQANAKPGDPIPPPFQKGVTETVVDVKSGMARIYRKLAPKIEHYKDSFLAGQLYDELENYAELHGAEREFKQMMNSARNRAHMEYDTNPGGFQNWFWFLPFEDEQLDEISRRDFLKGVGATAGLVAIGAPKQAFGQEVSPSLNIPFLDISELKVVFAPDPNPYYPSFSKRAGEQGEVVIRLFIDIEGKVDLVKLLKSCGFPRLDRMAMEIGKRYVFQPVMSGGKPISVTTNMLIKFRLNPTPPQNVDQYPNISQTKNSQVSVAEEAMDENASPYAVEEDVKKRMSKLEALALAANRAGDDAKCKMYQQKIQSLKQKLSQSMAEGWSDQGNPTPYSVYIDGREWRAYKSDDHARAVAEKVSANLKRQGRKQTVTIAPSKAKRVQEDFGMPGTTIPRKSVIQGYTVFFNPKTQVVSVTRGGDSEEAAIEQARVGTPSMKNFRQAADRLIDKIESDLNEAKEIVTKNDFLDRRDYLLRKINADPNPVNKQIIKAEIRKLESQAEAEGWITMQQRMVREDSDSGEAVEMAIMRRMLVAHTDLIVEFGLDRVVDAIEEVAYDVGDVDEIGTSDVSGWVRQVKQILGVDA